MYTQQKPVWVNIRKKLTICLEEKRECERERTLVKKRVGLSYPFLAPGVGGLVPAPLVMPPQSTMGSNKT